MRVILLGTAAGGGLPQWNCRCRNCEAARAGEIPARTQSSVALSADGRRWWVVNASPDLRAQLNGTPALWPSGEAARAMPLEGVLLTNADLDHTLGLFLLREGGAPRVWATPEVRETVERGLRLSEVLGAYGGVRWEALPTEWSALTVADGEPTGLELRMIPLGGEAPRYLPELQPSAPGHSVALEFREGATGRSLLVAPDVAAVTPELMAALERADAVLFDGTFWTDDELQRLQPGARNAAQMGHLPISTGSLPVLSGLRARHRILVHINNTNPMLRPESAEARQLAVAGVTVGWDGLEFEV